MPEPTRILFTVQDNVAYKTIQCKNGYTQFTVKAVHTGLNVGLFTAEDISEDSSFMNPKYIIEIAYEPLENSKVILKKNNYSQNLACASVPHILDNKEWKGFWVHIVKGTIAFGRENESQPIISWRDSKCIGVLKIGFLIRPYFFFDDDDLDERAGIADVVVDVSTRSEPSGVRWVKCSLGCISDNPFIGGHDNGCILYVIRAMIQRALTPGKLRNGSGFSEVSWGSRDNRIDDYEVLDDFDGEWVKTIEDKIPPLALLGGRTEDNIPLYIGRVSHNDTLTVGKVQPNHKACYIPFQGQELAFKEYEILCHKPPGLPVIPHPMGETPQEQQLKWVYSCNGRVPRNAFIVGQQNESVVLIRTNHKGFWMPGWLCSYDGPKTQAHVAYSYRILNVDEYEVLCDFNGHWEKPDGLIPPDNALLINGDEDIYVGRAWLQGRYLCGSVVNMSCRIAHENALIETRDFEILCYPNYVESATKNGLCNIRRWDV